VKDILRFSSELGITVTMCEV